MPDLCYYPDRKLSLSLFKPRIDFCPHCGNRTPQTAVHTHDYQLDSRNHETESGAQRFPSSYFLACCGTCNNLLLYHALGEAETKAQSLPGKDPSFYDAQLVYPRALGLPSSVPMAVRQAYEEAARIQLQAPNAYAVMIRRGLEALCDDRGVKKGSLQAKLAELADRGEIPSPLAEVTAVLRELGNVGAHHTGRNISGPMAQAMDEFFRVIVEYVYVAPSKLRTFKEQLAKAESG